MPKPTAGRPAPQPDDASAAGTPDNAQAATPHDAEAGVSDEAEVASSDATGVVETPSAPTGDRSDLRSAFREALERKSARNSHPESHLDGRTIGGGSNDTRKRQFRRKSG